ncbi:MAG: hypothetical protein JSR78_07220 [Proteobacteria bacterium]|nr:hypothetical protein [Pseudomonadota bacterium]
MIITSIHVFAFIRIATSGDVFRFVGFSAVEKIVLAKAFERFALEDELCHRPSFTTHRPLSTHHPHGAELANV